MLNSGDNAPVFTATDQHGNRVNLSDCLQQGPLVLYFYPADFTPVCTAEACAFRDRFDDLATSKIQIVGVSPQNAASHQRFAATHSLQFPLLSDEKKTIIRAYGVDGPLGFGVRRVTFYIDTTARIADRVVSDLFVGSHMDLIKRLLDRQA